jgi:hypothetical protein
MGEVRQIDIKHFLSESELSHRQADHDRSNIATQAQERVLARESLTYAPPDLPLLSE